jgi:hypothetical protein
MLNPFPEVLKLDLGVHYRAVGAETRKPPPLLRAGVLIVYFALVAPIR